MAVIGDIDISESCRPIGPIKRIGESCRPIALLTAITRADYNFIESVETVSKVFSESSYLTKSFWYETSVATP